MTKKLLLARPHPFIVEEMRPFLADAGYSTSKLEKLSDLTPALLASYSGAVISLAVLSPIGETAERVYAALRKHAPHLPVLFAGMTEFSSAAPSIARLANIEPSKVKDTSTVDVQEPNLRGAEFLLYLSKDILSEPKLKSAAAIMLGKYFR